MSLLAGKIAIITGAASGIGGAGAHAFAAAGATVVAADINEKGGERVAQEIGGGRAQFQSAELHHMGILQPEDIAQFATFLASDKAKRVTGGVFPVDAGYTAFKGLMSLKDTIAR
jgi:NAD(P)-dependent dehydrogenase (short-subunit alcohol dehydrogenase family)